MFRFGFRWAFQQKPEQREAVLAQGIRFRNKVLWYRWRDVNGQAFNKMRRDGVVQRGLQQRQAGVKPSAECQP